MSAPSPAPPDGPGVIERLRDAIRRRSYSYRTEQIYVDWARRFVAFTGGRAPAELGAEEVAAFLAHVARRPLTAAKRKQALGALEFLFREVLGKRLPGTQGAGSANRPIRFDLEQPRGQYRWAGRAQVRRYSGARSPRLRRGSWLPWSAA